MPTLITILVKDEHLTEDEERKLRYLFADAIADFWCVREPAEAYVTTRYSGETGVRRDRKIAEVRGRCVVARKLHNAVLSLDVKHLEEVEEVEQLDNEATGQKGSAS